MFSNGKLSISKDDILQETTRYQILYHYLGIDKIPIKINSPFRSENTPSFNIYEYDGEILWYDFGSNQHGSIWQLFCELWNMSFDNVLLKIHKDIVSKNIKYGTVKVYRSKSRSDSTICNIDIKVKTRQWNNDDVKYWEQFGITIPWLKFANVYPISRIFIYKDEEKTVLPADKLAYAYVEFKDDKQMMKIYQPLNNRGFKWMNCFNKSVISLWTKLPENGKILCICSSVKDSLCLWKNIGIPAIAPQGEGYPLSNTVINQLKSRFENIFILYDNDDAGITDSAKLSKETGFTEIILPKINNAKDISDLYKTLNNPIKFKQIISNLFKYKLQ